MVLRSTEQLGGEGGPLSFLSMLTPHTLHQHKTSNSRVTKSKSKFDILIFNKCHFNFQRINNWIDVLT